MTVMNKRQINNWTWWKILSLTEKRTIKARLLQSLMIVYGLSARVEAYVYKFDVLEQASVQTYGISGGAMFSYPTRHAAFINLTLPVLTLTNYDVAVIGSTELGYPSLATSPYAVYSTAPTFVSNYQYWRNGTLLSAPAVVYQGYGGGLKFPLGLAVSQAYTSGTIEVVVVSHYTGTPISSAANYYRFDLSKLLCSDASIDTRRTFGSPNLAGKLPGDPNVTSAPANFGTYTYHGGLFVGNVPSGSGDHSGTARMQLYVGGSSSGTYLASGLSVLDMGTPTNYTGASSVGVYAPKSTDANLATNEASVTWDSKWAISPRTSIPQGQTVDYSQDAISSYTLSSTATVNTYLNFNLADTTGALVPLANQYLCLALTNEASPPSAWRYFCSKERALDPNSVFPQNDGQPRVWRAGLLEGVLQ